jgi:hypothetical protein
MPGFFRCSVPCLGLELTIHVIKIQIHLMRQSLLEQHIHCWTVPLKGPCYATVIYTWNIHLGQVQIFMYNNSVQNIGLHKINPSLNWQGICVLYNSRTIKYTILHIHV